MSIKSLTHKTGLVLVLAISFVQGALADSMTVVETWKDNTTAGVFTSSTDVGAFSASLTVAGLSNLTADDWANLQVTINSDNLYTFADGSGDLGGFSDVMGDAPNYGGTISSTSATFYGQLADTDNNLVNAYKMTFSRSGNTFTIAGQTINPASMGGAPWPIAAWNFFDDLGLGVTFAATNPISCEVVLADTATTMAQYADVVRTMYLVGTNTITYDADSVELYNIRMSGFADFTPPTLVALSPAASGAVTNGLLNVQVKATDNVGVTNVEFFFDGLDFGPGIFDGTNKWSMFFPLMPGANFIQNMATDASGNLSATNSLTMTYVNKQTNANLITFSEWQVDSQSYNAVSNTLELVSEDVDIMNAALLVPGLQVMSADTWSNLSLSVTLGTVNFDRTLNAADVLTGSNATFISLDGYELKVSRAGNTLVLAFGGGFEPDLADGYRGQSGAIVDTTSFALSLSDGTTSYANLSRTLFISGRNVISYDSSGDELDNIQITGAADFTLPTVSLTAPVNGQRWSNSVFTVTGKAGDNNGVEAVYYSINNTGWTLAISTNNWTNWTGNVSLMPGTNTIQAYALDLSGNVSATNTASIFDVVSAQLQLQAIGLGTITPDYSNAWLQIGGNYSLTSAPASGFKSSGWTVSTNWLGGTLVANKVVTFTMASNLTLLVAFTDTNKPILAVTAPTAGQRMTNALATVRGTASDNWAVAGVWYELNGMAWSLASTTNNWTNWGATLPLLAGTNMLKACALDLGGNYSLTNSVSFVSSNGFFLKLSLSPNAPMTSNGLTFTLLTSGNLNGHLECSSNLINWVSWTNFKGTNTSILFRDPAATNSARGFYRAVVP